MASSFTLFAGLLLVAVAAAQDLSAIPQACINYGGALQTECGSTFTEAQTFFKVQPGQIPPPGSITPAQIQAYLKQAKPPSPGCCKVACQFNNAFCSCEKAVVDFAASLAGNAEIFNSVGSAFAAACKFKPFIATSCPAPTLRPTVAKTACPARRLM